MVLLMKITPVILMWLVLSTCQASVIPKGIHKDNSNTLGKVWSGLQKILLWNTFRGLCSKAHEFLWGKDDGQSKCNAIRANCNMFWHTRKSIPEDQSSGSSTGNRDPRDKIRRCTGLLPTPPAGNNPQPTVSAENNDDRSQANCCGGNCCNKKDCKKCTEYMCCCCLELACDPDVICCCFSLFQASGS